MSDASMFVPGGPELLLAVLHLVVVGGTVALAARRGRSPWVWGLLAFFGSVLAATVLLALPRRGQADRRERTASSPV